MTIFWHAKRFLLGITAYVVLTSWATAEMPVQPLDAITSAVAAASTLKAEKQGYNNVDVNVRPLDNRLRLPECSEPLSTFFPPGSNILGAVSVGVRCSGEKSWTIYARAQVNARTAIPVLRRPMPRHSLITEDDLEMINQPAGTANTQGIILDPSQIIGMEITRALNAGSAIKPSQLRAPKVIARGQQVLLVSGNGGLKVRMQGKALKDAAVGERVKVTNLSSGQKIEGIANADGTVSVP